MLNCPAFESQACPAPRPLHLMLMPQCAGVSRRRCGANRKPGPLRLGARNRTYLSLGKCAPTKSKWLTPLYCALTKLLDLKSPEMNTYTKNTGGTSALSRKTSGSPGGRRAKFFRMISFTFKMGVGVPRRTYRAKHNNRLTRSI